MKGCHYTNAIARLAPGVSLAAAREDLDRIMDDLGRQFPDYLPGQARAPRTSVGGGRRQVSQRRAHHHGGGSAGSSAGIHQRRRPVRRPRPDPQSRTRHPAGSGRRRLENHARGPFREPGARRAGGRAWTGRRPPPCSPSSASSFRPIFRACRRSSSAGRMRHSLSPPGWRPAPWPASSRSFGRCAPTPAKGSPKTPAPPRPRAAPAVFAADWWPPRWLWPACSVLRPGCLLRSSLALAERPHGFRPDNVLTFELSFPDKAYDGRLAAFYAEAVRRFHEIPGVRAAGFSTSLPWTGYDENTSFDIDGYVPRPGESLSARYQAADPAFFDAIGTRLLQRPVDFPRG